MQRWCTFDPTLRFSFFCSDINLNTWGDLNFNIFPPMGSTSTHNVDPNISTCLSLTVQQNKGRKNLFLRLFPNSKSLKIWIFLSRFAGILAQFYLSRVEEVQLRKHCSTKIQIFIIFCQEIYFLHLQQPFWKIAQVDTFYKAFWGRLILLMVRTILQESF